MKYYWLILPIQLLALVGAAQADATLYVATGGGICKSIDGGVTWRFIRITSTDPRLTQAADMRGIVLDPQNPSTVYGTALFRSTSAFLKSTDSGETWTAFAQPSSVSFDLGPGALTIDPVKTNVFYSSTFATRRFEVSTDEGRTWTEPNMPKPAGAPGTTQPQIAAAATDPNRSGVVYATGPQDVSRPGAGYILQSTDFGTTWNILVTGQNVNGHLFVDPRNSQVLYAASAYTILTGCPNGGMCSLAKSSDGGKSWTDLPFPTSNVQSLAFDVNSSVMYAATGAPLSGVWKTTDGGNSWTQVLKNSSSTGFALGGAAVRADSGTPPTLWASVGSVAGQSISRSTDGSANWTSVTVPQAGVQDFVVVGSGGPPAPAPPSGTVTGTVSATGQQAGPFAAESIVVATGTHLATGSASGDPDQPPMTLAGTTVNLTDSAGVTRPAVLLSVSGTQVTYQIPPGTAVGAATVTVTAGDGAVATAQLQIVAVAPGLYTQNSSGLAKGYVVRFSGGNSLIEDVFEIDPNGAVIPHPIAVSNGDQVYLLAYGGGFRAAGGDVSAIIGGITAPVLYAGPQGVQTGLDQFNILIPPELGTGAPQVVQIVLTASGQPSNPVNVTVK
jgi:uncharacterized protein (TIGR03437 family)